MHQRNTDTGKSTKTLTHVSSVSVLVGIRHDIPMRHRDVMYVSNALAAELQKFLNIVGSVVVPILIL